MTAETPLAKLRELERRWTKKAERFRYRLGYEGASTWIQDCATELSALLTDLEAAPPTVTSWAERTADPMVRLLCPLCGGWIQARASDLDLADTGSQWTCVDCQKPVVLALFAPDDYVKACTASPGENHGD